MGFFNSITKAAKVVKKTTVKALDLNAAFFTNPVTFIKSPTAAVQKFKKQSVKERTLRTIGTTATLGAAVLTGGTSLGRSTAAKAATTAGKALVPKTAKGALVTAVAAPAAIGVLSSSKTARKATVGLISPIENVKRGQSIGTALEKTSGKKDIADIAVKGAFLGTGAAALAGGVVVGKKLLDKQKSSKSPIPQGATPVTVNGQQIGSIQKAPAAQTIPKTTPGQVAEKPVEPQKQLKPMKVTTNVKLINNNNIAIAQ